MINVTGAGDEYRNLLNGIVTIRANDYVTNGINANPETKLMYGQFNAPIGNRPSRPVTYRHANIAHHLSGTHQGVSYLYTLGADEPIN
jgi:hypothetical protein